MTESTIPRHLDDPPLAPVPLRPEPVAPVHVGGARREPDLARAELAAGDFLAALGMSLDAPHLAETPGRMARAWAEMLTPREFALTTFPNDEQYDELVVVRDIAVRSICEHHLLPFTGRACVGYLPGERIVGLSKLARIVEHFARRPQTQERLTKQIADWLEQNLTPRAVGVVIAAEHSCMTMRGALAAGTSTVTSTLLGSLRDDPRSRQEFLALAGLSPA
ncbi:GTP cyclohydrolase I FolE [Microbacterium pseudoresistens]|uniref:GTP cyclohydrolase 1 n=1 Tax=Microbacterium pseudoresistens TaxID=640634 RepID=A0A7Y9EU76_9MICO|nr:GTP cyclohydrolase I FolE [Microbacterium pseudoresistens]NYD54042.1 GTP cyclohydrolase I [Microbacterium pseudoresistens]